MASVKDIIRNVSNDFGILGNAFQSQTGFSLLGHDAQTIRSSEMISVVIPVFKGTSLLAQLIDSLRKQFHERFEVVLVEDCPNSPSLQYCNELLDGLNIKVIIHEDNLGRSCARNTGILFCEGNSILFVDQDMVLPPHFLSEMAIRQQVLSNVVLVGFRDNLTTEFNASGPQSTPQLSKDWRYWQPFHGNLMPIHLQDGNSIPEERSYYLINETNYFRDFGLGRIVGFWDLPAMVISHSLCAKTCDIKRVGGYPEAIIRGWGGEDLALGAALIALGNFVIPVPTCVSWHQYHERHSSSRHQEWNEFKDNFARYAAYASQSLTSYRLPPRKIARIKTQKVEAWRVSK